MLNRKLSRFHLLLLIELLVVLMLLPGCFRGEQLICRVGGEDMTALDSITGGVRYQGGYLELEPGVYRVRARCHPGDSQSLYIDICCDDNSFRALRSNVVPVFSNQTSVDFEVYVLKKLSGAYLQCDITGGGAELVERLEVYRTGLGSRMLLFLAVCCFMALDGLLFWRRRILEGKVGREQQLVFWSLVGVVLLAYFPFLTDYFLLGEDSSFHLMRIEGLAESWLNGSSLPVRVQSYWLSGHGYAVSLFYSDLFFSIPALLRVIGFSIMTSYKMFVLLAISATAAISYFSFQRCVKSAKASLTGTVLYVLAPYYFVNIYSRGAVGEFLAMSFLPLVACGMYLLLTEDTDSRRYRSHKWYIVAGMTGLLQSHLLSTEMTAFFMLVVCLICWKKVFRRQTFLQLAETVGIVLLVNCCFWLPMLYMMSIDSYGLKEIINRQIVPNWTYLAGLLQIVPNMGTLWQPGVSQSRPIQLGPGGMLVILAFFVLRIWKGRRGSRVEKLLLCLTGLAVLLTTSYLPWNALAEIPVVGRLITAIQFPTRFMSPAAMFCAMFCVFFCQGLQEGRYARMIRLSAVFLAVGSAIYQVDDIAFTSYPTYLYEAENMGTNHVSNGEYVLAGIKMELTDFYYHGPAADAGLQWWNYEKNGTEITISLKNKADGVSYLELPLMGYRGYAVEVTDGKEGGPYLTEERGAHGDLRLAVPGGFEGTIRVCYKGFMVFRAAELVSSVSMLLLLGYELWRRRQKC